MNKATPGKKFIVFDLDGTIALDAHRAVHLKTEPKDWALYFSLCESDIPALHVIEVLRELSYSNHVEIWSGRSDQVRRETMRWLDTHIFKECLVDEVRLRSAGDFTHDDELKRKWLHEARAEGREVLMAFEDRARVVAMWRAEGVPCFQVAEGNF
jgi:phosphoglycolate phosphatase-like HAD superfamily hydrolase